MACDYQIFFGGLLLLLFLGFIESMSEFSRCCYFFLKFQTANGILIYFSFVIEKDYCLILDGNIYLMSPNLIIIPLNFSLAYFGRLGHGNLPGQKSLDLKINLSLIPLFSFKNQPTSLSGKYKKFEKSCS